MFFWKNFFKTQQELDCRHDPLLTHCYTKEEFKEAVKSKMKKLDIGETLQVFVAGKLRVLKKISKYKIAIEK